LNRRKPEIIATRIVGKGGIFTKLLVHLGQLHIYIDGSSKGNPGPSGIGVLVKDVKGQSVATISEYIGTRTNNVAEYLSLLVGLQKAKQLGAREVKVFSDSQLLVLQLKGIFKVKNPYLKKLYDDLFYLIQSFKRFEIESIPREANREADSLATQAVQQYLAGKREESNLEKEYGLKIRLSEDADLHNQ
jgi:ribonuclease HI